MHFIPFGEGVPWPFFISKISELFFQSGHYLSGLTFMIQPQQTKGGEQPMTAIERREAILDALCVRRQEQISNLAEEFGVNERTIRRDLLELGCSYPIETTRGNGGGVKIADWYHRDRRYLSPEQADLLSRLTTSVEGADLEILTGILRQFAPYKN